MHSKQFRDTRTGAIVTQVPLTQIAHFVEYVPGTVRDTLIKARGWIARGWCQRTSARAADGSQVMAADALATQWCAVGACARASFDDIPTERIHLFDNALATLRDVIAARDSNYSRSEPVAVFNDAHGRTQAEVLAVFDAAIEACHD
jgi:hypothetical protein